MCSTSDGMKEGEKIVYGEVKKQPKKKRTGERKKKHFDGGDKYLELDCLLLELHVERLQC